MARKYFFKFKTFQEHTCRVDIYDSTFSGTATELSKDVAGSPGCPSDEPLIIEEDHSDNLLDNVRTKTGYINLVELTTGGLQDLFPQRNDSLEVYALMDVADNVSATDAAEDNVIFHGYVQAQSFDNDYLAYRSELSIPLTSIMGVIQDQPITTDSNRVIDIFNESFDRYKYIVMPVLNYENMDENYEHVLNLEIQQEVLYPINGSYNYGVKQDSDDETPQPLSPITKKEFVQKFCNLFGLISHDVGNMIVFTKIGFTGEYRRYSNDTDWDSSPMLVGYGNTAISFNSTFQYASNKNNLSTVNSLKKITMEWEDLPLPQSVDFSVASYKGMYGSLSILQYQGYNINIPAGRVYSTTTQNATFIVGDGSKEMIEANGGASNDRLFSCYFTFWGCCNNIHLEADTDHMTGNIAISVLNIYGEYYNFDYDPEDPAAGYWTETFSSKSIQFVNGNADIELKSFVNGQYLALSFYNNSGSSMRIRLTKIELQNTDNPSKYQVASAASNKVVVALDDNSIDSEELNIDFWRYSFGFMSKPSVNYLGISQRNLKLFVRKKTSITELEMLIGKMAMTNSDQNNRVISIRNTVRDDICELQVMGNQYF